MGRKYVAQLNNENFVFPNYKISEYDIDINHDLKENSVSGSTTGFSALYNAGTGNISVSFTYQWYLNNAEPYINSEGDLAILSLHMMSTSKKYNRPWICVGHIDDNNTSLTYKTDTQNFVITPQMAGVGSFVDGEYYFEVRFIGHRSIYPLPYSYNVLIPTPTPTPTGTGPTPTPTPSSPCRCFEIIITGTTVEEGFAASISYNDCYGVATIKNYTVGPALDYLCIQRIAGVTQWDPMASYGIDPSSLNFPGANCAAGEPCGPVVTFTPTPSPTPTSTPGGPTFTPTPTPTATGTPPTYTPTPTPTATPTATPVVYTYSLGYNATDSYAACLDYSSSPANYYSYNAPPLANGHILYTINGTPLSGNAPTGYYSNGTSQGYVPGDSGVINGIAPCATSTPTPTPTPIYQGVAIYTGATFNSAANACANGSSPNGSVYVSVAELPVGDGDRLYTNTSLTTNFVGNDQYYRIFINPSWYVATISAAGYISNFTNCSAVPTLTPTPTPTATGLPPTDTPTPTPTGTPTPTPFQTTFSGYVSLVDGPTACAGGEYGTVNVTVQGTSLCVLTKALGLSSTIYGNVYADMTNNDTFYVSNGTDWVEFLRDGSAQTGTPQTSCTTCGGPTDTPTPTPTATPGGPTPTPTPTATSIPLTTYTGCGYGATEPATCTDAGNNRTLYSDCDSISFGVGCQVFVDLAYNALTGYNFVQINSATWAINSSTGIITGLASEQC